MTAYELASLHAQIAQTMNAQIANWFTILSVYLGAGYLVAHRMSFPSAVALTVIAVAALASFARIISQTQASFLGVSGEIKKLALHGGGLEWHQATNITEFAKEWFPTNALIAMLVMIGFAIYFFFSSRRHNLKAAQPAPKTDAASATTE